MWVKICGITATEDARIAVNAGADAIGFIFAESPRRVTPETARKIVDSLPPEIEKIGVFVDATLETVLETVNRAGLTGVQLHGEDRSGIAASVREHGRRISSRLRIVHVLHYAGDPQRFAAQLHGRMHDPIVDTILVDTGIAGRRGGTGIPFDWQGAQAGFAEASARVRLIAAGGLNPENVGRAIATLQPWGVDVSSGVEFAPGRKHPERVESFVRFARQSIPVSGKASAGVQK